MAALTLELNEFREALQSHAGRYEVELSTSHIARLGDYYQLLLEWNPRAHLVAPCSPDEFATRHVLESLLLLPHLAEGARIADVGSGAGLPIIPVLIVRSDISVTLIESSKRKSVFLREALRVTATSEQASVISERFENVAAPDVDYVSCRALDRFMELFPALVGWARGGAMLLLFGGNNLREEIAKASLTCTQIKIPDSDRRFLFVIKSEPPAVAGG